MLYNRFCDMRVNCFECESTFTWTWQWASHLCRETATVNSSQVDTTYNEHWGFKDLLVKIPVDNSTSWGFKPFEVLFKRGWAAKYASFVSLVMHYKGRAYYYMENCGSFYVQPMHCEGGMFTFGPKRRHLWKSCSAHIKPVSLYWTTQRPTCAPET